MIRQYFRHMILVSQSMVMAMTLLVFILGPSLAVGLKMDSPLWFAGTGLMMIILVMPAYFTIQERFL